MLCEATWPGVSALPDFKSTFPKFTGQPLSAVVRNLDAQGLDAGERWEEHLGLVRVLREPRQIGAAVDHAHLHLEDSRQVMSMGILGAGITISSVLAIAKKGAEDQGDILPIVTSLVSGKGDLKKNATTGECDQMSAGLQFTGVSAFFFPADVTGTGK